MVGGKPHDRERQDREDMQLLVQRPEFIRFCWRVIQRAHIFHRTADGSGERNPLIEGRRDLGLEILAMVEAGQPVPHPEGLPILTILRALREEASSPQPGEKTHAKRYNRTAEIYDPDADDDDAG